MKRPLDLTHTLVKPNNASVMILDKQQQRKLKRSLNAMRKKKNKEK